MKLSFHALVTVLCLSSGLAEALEDKLGIDGRNLNDGRVTKELTERLVGQGRDIIPDLISSYKRLKAAAPGDVLKRLPFARALVQLYDPEQDMEVLFSLAIRDASAMQQLLLRPIFESDEGIDFLFLKLGSEDLDQRFTASQALKRGEAGTIRQKIADVLEGRSKSRKDSVLMLWRHFLKPEDLSVLRKVALDQKEKMRVRTGAIVCISRMRSDEARDLIRELCSDSSPPMRAAAVSVMPQVPKREGDIDILLKALDDPDRGVRYAAIYAVQMRTRKVIDMRLLKKAGKVRYPDFEKADRVIRLWKDKFAN